MGTSEIGEHERAGSRQAVVHLAIDLCDDLDRDLVTGLEIVAWVLRRAGQDRIAGIPDELHLLPIGIVGCGLRRSRRRVGVIAIHETRLGEMFPNQIWFDVTAAAGWRHDLTVAIPVRRRPLDIRRGQVVVARQATEPVLEAVERRFDAVLLRDEIADAGAGDQFLALEDAAEQQADDHEHDRDFDQGEALVAS